tara:strand:+ start:1368 stop:1658 length:291 start_codon:yes stop_codon:yes gene_type:complete
MKKSYFLRVLIILTAAFNVIILNGDEDHTTSGRIGWKAKFTGKKRYLIAEKFINTLFFWDKDHCRKSIELDEYKDYSFTSWNLLTVLALVYVLLMY